MRAESPVRTSGDAKQTQMCILVVDDDKVVTQMLHRWLSDAGYRCLVATTAEEGWNILQDKSNTISLVITDANMPGEYDGFGLLDRVMKLKEEEGIDVIMMSGQDKEIAVRGVTLGSKDFLAKPLIKALLLRKVELHLAHRQSKMELQRERLEKEELRKEVAALSEMMGRRTGIVETPVQTITNIISSLLAHQNVPAEIRLELQRVKDIAVNGANFYQPTMTIGQNPSVDAVTKSFLLNELSIRDAPVAAPAAFAAIRVELMAEVTQWSFRVLERTEEELLTLTKQMFVQLGLLTHFNIKEEVLERFLVYVRRNYNPNPYHNWRHAVDVTQAVFLLSDAF